MPVVDLSVKKLVATLLPLAASMMTLAPVQAATSSPTSSSSPAESFSALSVVDGTGTQAGTATLTWASTSPDIRVYQVPSPTAVAGPLVYAGPGTGSTTVAEPAAGAGQPQARVYYRFVTHDGVSLVAAERGLHLPDANNARDFGGYPTGDGHWVRTGMLFRANALNSLSPTEWADLEGLGVDHDVDLRNIQERQQDPDNAPAGVDYQVADVEGVPPTEVPGLDPILGTARCANPLTAVNLATVAQGTPDSSDLGTAEGYLAEACAVTPLQAWHDLVTAVADDPGHVVFHCTAGKDRTGVGAAIVLSLLGVPWDDVMQDFLLSNTYHGSGSVEAAWLQGWHDEMVDDWGDIDDFATQGLGLEQATIDKLRSEYLTTGAAVRSPVTLATRKGRSAVTVTGTSYGAVPEGPVRASLDGSHKTVAAAQMIDGRARLWLPKRARVGHAITVVYAGTRLNQPARATVTTGQ